MAKVKVSQLDVWIVESNTVYQAVPFSVVTDWIVQGRLLAEDCIRPAGSKEWFKVASVKQLAAYLPQPETQRAEDEAEALEPVAFDLTYQRPRAEEDEEVDMIPLIDVSLVLLIFFMMVLAGAAPAMTVPLPRTDHGDTTRDREAVIVLIDYRNEEPRYGVMKGEKPVKRADGSLVLDVEDPNEIVREVQLLMEASPNKVNLSINAHKDLPSGAVRDLAARLTIVPAIRGKMLGLYYGTSEKK